MDENSYLYYKRKFYSDFAVDTVGLKISVTKKINLRKIATYF